MHFCLALFPLHEPREWESPQPSAVPVSGTSVDPEASLKNPGSDINALFEQARCETVDDGAPNRAVCWPPRKCRVTEDLC